MRHCHSSTGHRECDILCTSMYPTLRQHFGYESFRPLQEDIITHILGGQHALVLMPTGGGKSLCYQLPSLMLSGLTLVVSPLIALMKDQVDTLRANGIEAAYLNSTISPSEQAEVLRQAQAGELKLLYIAPERITQAVFQQILQSLPISLLAIDEAHCISEWGHDFRPDYRNLRLLRTAFPAVPVIALTASATPQVAQDIAEQLGMQGARIFLSSFNRPNLTYTVEPKKDAFKKVLALLKQLDGESAIIYCFSRADCDDMAAKLSKSGVPAIAYHAGMTPDARSRAQEQFIRDGISVICATIAFGMGIDKPDIRLVVHCDLPKSVEGYYQETGRAGRDGLPAECVLLYSYGDTKKQEFFIRNITNPEEQALARKKLKDMVDYCESARCRRGYLMQYFGEEWHTDNCGSCDLCLGTGDTVDATEISQKILSCILRTGERFGAGHIAQVLTGQKNPKIKQYAHDQLSTYGIAQDTPEDAITHYIRQLVRRGLLVKADGQYPTLAVSNTGKASLKNRTKILLPPPRERKVKTLKAATIAALDYDTGLFDQLRSVRKAIAEEQGVPPYVIFSDKTLIDMAHHAPRTLASLSTVSGVGEHKLAAFGDAFLAALTTYADTHSIPEQSRAYEKRERRAVGDIPGNTYQETLRCINTGMPLVDIAKLRGLAESTIAEHVERLVTTGDITDITPLLPPPDDLARITAAFDQLSTERLAPVHEFLDKKHTYATLRVVRAQRGMVVRV